MTRLVQIALVGAGEIGAAHVRAHAAVPGIRLRTICDMPHGTGPATGGASGSDGRSCLRRRSE